MVNPGPPQSPWLVPEALGTGAILAEMAAIFAAHSGTFREDRTDCTPEECLGQGIHYFLSHLLFGEVLDTGLERVTLVRVDPDRRVHLMHLLFSVRVNVYSNLCCLFA